MPVLLRVISLKDSVSPRSTATAPPVCPTVTFSSLKVLEAAKVPRPATGAAGVRNPRSGVPTEPVVKPRSPAAPTVTLPPPMDLLPAISKTPFATNVSPSAKILFSGLLMKKIA